MPGSRKSSRQFAFKRHDEIECLEFDIERHQEFLDELTIDNLRNYIIEEAKGVQAQRENDVSIIT